MSNIFFTSDSHFWHRNVIRLCGRPYAAIEEMNQDLIRNWNSRVQDGDLVYHLGDFAFCGTNKMKEILAQLKGTKILVLGNHDQSANRMKKVGFDVVIASGEFKYKDFTFLLSHYPYAPTKWQTRVYKLKNFWKFWRKKKYMNLRYLNLRPQNNGMWLLHGHSHNKPERRVRGRQIDVGVDANGYAPISIDEILQIVVNSHK
jgi:calcineurin-like phosphoesterase family protein